MALTAKSNGSGGDFETAPAGNHVAICYSVVDLGEHESDWQGKVSMKHRIRLSWELCDELMSDGRPFSISREYTLSLNEKATLCHDLESWRGRAFSEQELEGFDVFNVLGKPAMVNVVHKARRDGTGSYAAVANVAAIPKGLPARERANDLIRFSMEEPEAEQLYGAFPQWLKDRIKFIAPHVEQETAADLNDDIPF